MSVIRVACVGFITLSVTFALLLAEHIQRTRDWMFRDAPPWATEDLFRYLRVLVPILAITHLAITAISYLQQRNSTQKSLTRFMAAKVIFWFVVEFSLYHRATNLWVLLDAVAFTIVAMASLDTLIRFFIRYVLGKIDKDEMVA